MADRSVNVKLRMDIAQYLASARGASAATRDVDKAARDLRKSLDEEEAAAGRVRVAEARLNEVRADGKAKASQLAAAEEDLARAHRQHEAAAERVTESTRRYSEALKQSEQDSERSTKKISANLATLAKASLGLPVAAAAGAAGTAASLALLATGFAALGVAGVAKTAEVQAAVHGLKDRVVNDVQAMSRPLTGDVVGALDQFGAAWGRIRPLVAQAVQGSAPAIEELAGTVTDLAENAMPGMVTAVDRSGPALVGLRAFAAQAGTGVSELFENVSQGSVGAQRGLTVFGGTVETLAGRIGTMFANLANSSEQPLRSLDVIVDQITAGLVALTAQGSGALGFLQGFSSAGVGLATILHGALAAVSALPPQVTQLAGSVGAAGMVLNKFGVDIGAGFDGLGGRIKAAEGAGGKFKATMSGLASAALNPATLAAGGLGIALWGLGAAQEKAAASAAEYRENVRTLTDAIRQDKGEVSEATATANMHALTQKNAAANIGVAGVAFAQATVAANGNASAMRSVTDQTNEWIQSVAQKAGVGQKDIDVAKSMNKLLLDQGGAYDQLNPLLQKSGKSQEQVTEANRSLSTVLGKLGPQQAGQLVALLNGTGAIGEQAKATRDAYAAYLLQEQGLTDLSEAQIKARDSATEHTQAIYEQVNASLGLRGAQMNSAQALQDYNKSLKGGSEDDKAAALFRLEQAWQSELVAVQKNTEAHSQARTPEGKHAEGMAAMNQRAVELANTFSGPLPASMAETISNMRVSEARAAGLTVAIDSTGNAVYRLPNGKDIRISASTGQAQAAVNELIAAQNALRNKEVTYTIVNRVVNLATSGGAYQPSLSGRRAYGAAGGPIADLPTKQLAAGGLTGLARGGATIVDITGGGLLRGPGTGTSDSILAMSSRGPVDTSDGEFVVRASQTRKYLPLLTAINEGREGFAAGGPVAYGSVSQATWDGLYAAGWRGNPTDGMEALYPPSATTYAQTPVQQAIASGTVVQQVPSFARSYAGGGSASGGGKFEGNLYLDNGQFLGMVRGEIRKSNRAIRRSVTTGSGGNR